ncbi:MAG: late competence development ComFB family protein [Treponema sp.]|nr:late competence development ComFB family protein [Treponema sp.]
MNVHNLMEDVVSHTVNELYDNIKEEGASWLSCDCENCRLDTISYVLNRVPAKYIVSGRGITHAAEVLEDLQIKADVEALALEGMHIVSDSKRPFHLSERKDNEAKENTTPCFNFPTFTGTVIDGGSFEPVPGAELLLKYEGKPAEMMDKSWSNPLTTVKSTHGAYSFWVKPIPAEKAGITKKFKFAIEVTADGYEPRTYHFIIPMISDDVAQSSLDSTISFKLKDLVIFKEFMINPME